MAPRDVLFIAGFSLLKGPCLFFSPEIERFYSVIDKSCVSDKNLGPFSIPGRYTEGDPKPVFTIR
ncbi:hypothetical protein QTP88_022223 [Uroleucon formosanum]